MKAFTVGIKDLNDRMLSSPRIQQGLFNARLRFNDAIYLGAGVTVGAWVAGTKILTAPSIGEAVVRAAQGNILEAASFGAVWFGLGTVANFTVGAMFKPKTPTEEVIQDVERIRSPKM